VTLILLVKLRVGLHWVHSRADPPDSVVEIGPGWVLSLVPDANTALFRWSSSCRRRRAGHVARWPTLACSSRYTSVTASVVMPSIAMCFQLRSLIPAPLAYRLLSPFLRILQAQPVLARCRWSDGRAASSPPVIAGQLVSPAAQRRLSLCSILEPFADQAGGTHRTSIAPISVPHCDNAAPPSALLFVLDSPRFLSLFVATVSQTTARTVRRPNPLARSTTHRWPP